MKKVKTFIVRAAKDVDDKLFWKQIFVLLTGFVSTPEVLGELIPITLTWTRSVTT